jgi:L-asparaginase/N4-(beta-N-acetylglucosaminyl)-L-asparaginase
MTRRAPDPVGRRRRPDGGQATTTRTQPIAIATWNFGLEAVQVAGAMLAKGAPALDAVEAGIRAVEADSAVRSAGYGSLPNAEGVVELDAAIMDGPTHRAGAVAALRATMHPISVARQVMERSPHVMLVGGGARRFAREHGFRPTRLLTRAAREAWLQRRDKAHDTVAVLAVDKRGYVAAGCSTSGLPGKLPGRVGDSPIIGAGLYCDNEVGAAGATGIGEYVLRVGGSHMVVTLMGAGLAPQDACRRALVHLRNKTRPSAGHQVAFIALARDGRYGAAALEPGFLLAVWRAGQATLSQIAPLGSHTARSRREGDRTR